MILTCRNKRNSPTQNTTQQNPTSRPIQDTGEPMIKTQDGTLRSLPIRYKTTNGTREAALKQQDGHKNTPKLRSQRVKSNFSNEMELHRAHHSDKPS